MIYLFCILLFAFFPPRSAIMFVTYNITYNNLQLTVFIAQLFLYLKRLEGGMISQCKTMLHIFFIATIMKWSILGNFIHSTLWSCFWSQQCLFSRYLCKTPLNKKGPSFCSVSPTLSLINLCIEHVIIKVVLFFSIFFLLNISVLVFLILNTQSLLSLLATDFNNLFVYV